MALLTTPRLHLRPLDAGDRALHRSLYTDPVVMREIASPLTASASDRAFDAVLARVGGDAPRYHYWVVEIRAAGGEAIGIIALHRHDDGAEIGVMLDARHHRSGIAREAFEVLVPYALDNLDLSFIDAERADDGHARAIDGLLLPLGFRAQAAPTSGRRRWRRDRTAGRAAVGSSPRED
ncbi:GNAT family N-acetyltransferase [Cognatilysobacter lacus]|nr:GNAT family N-acetyltransferase [Lysobacter lacus]